MDTLKKRTIVHESHSLLSLDPATLAYLQELGLSSDAIDLYAAIRFHHKLSALAASKCIDKFPQALYRLFYELESLGLTRREGTRPMVFHEVATVVGLPAAYSTKNQRLTHLLHQTGESILAHEHTEIIIGKEALYERYPDLALAAQSHIRIFSIGIAYSEVLADTQQQVRARGVQVQHLVQERRPSNYYILKTWRDLGVEMRILPRARGFHLMVFDDTAAVITFSSSQDTEDRVSMLTYHPAAVSALREVFDGFWEESESIQWLSEKA